MRLACVCVLSHRSASSLSPSPLTSPPPGAPSTPSSPSPSLLVLSFAPVIELDGKIKSVVDQRSAWVKLVTTHANYFPRDELHALYTLVFKHVLDR